MLSLLRKVTLWLLMFVGVVLAADYLAGLAPKQMLVIGPIAVSLGTPLIGLALALRDTLQRRYGKQAAKLAILLAAAASVGFAAMGGTPWSIIIASAAAFVLSESIDYLIYTYVKGLGEGSRIILSNAVSAPVDSIVFVTIAFGFSWEFVWSQALVKMVATLLYVLLRWVLAKRTQAPPFTSPLEEIA